MMTSQESSLSQIDREGDGNDSGAPPPSLSAARFPKWIALSVLSLVAWFATIGGVRRHQMDRAEKWALSATTLSVVFAVLGVLCYVFARGMFMGESTEVAVAVFILAIWSGGLPVIMNPANSIAIGFTDHFNANLYFAAWFSFGTVLWICGDLAKELYGMDVAGMATPLAKARRGKWYALIATSVIVLSSSVRLYRAFPCSADNLSKSPICQQTKFAVSAGVIGTVTAMMATLCLASGRTVSPRVDWCLAGWMVLIWSFGLGFITFGEGPGTNIGNLFFATWGSFVLSVMLVAESYRDYLAVRENAMNANAQNTVDEEGIDPILPIMDGDSSTAKHTDQSYDDPNL